MSLCCVTVLCRYFLVSVLCTICHCAMSVCYVSETGYHYVLVLCRCAVSVFFSVLCTVCACVMSPRLDIIMSYYVAVVQSVCYAPYVTVLCQRDWISLCPWAVSLFFRHYVIHSLPQWQLFVFFFRHSVKTSLLFCASAVCRQSTLPAALIEFPRPLLLNIVPNSYGCLFLAVHMIEQYH